MPKRRILLVNFGGARSEAEVPLFLRKLIGGEPTRVMTEGAISRYRAIGGCSPLPAVTEELATLLGSRFAAETDVKAVFMYSHPSIQEGTEGCYASRVQEVFIFILSPYYSVRTTGEYLRIAENGLTRLGGYKPAITFIHSWYAEPLFVEWWAQQVRKAAEAFPDAFFLFSAHSLPLSQAQDSYAPQIEETVWLVAEKARLTSYTVGWQSAPAQCEEEWTGPSVERVFDLLKKQGVKRVIQVPIGFIMDHLETLYDIDVIHKRYAEALGMSHQRLACPNTDPLFVNALSTILSDRLKEAR